MSKILITGATGTVGTPIVAQLAKRSVPARAMVHSAEKAGAIAAPGIEIVQGDFDDSASLDTAMRGMETLLLLTPPHSDQVAWHRNAIAAAQRAGMKYVVRVSAIGADEDGATSLARWHGQSERELEASGLAYTHLQPHTFMQNLLGSADSVAATGTLYAPMKDGKVAMVDARDIAAVAFGCLTTAGHVGKTYLITGPQAVSYAEVAAALSAATGRQITYVDVPLEVARQGMVDAGMPQWIADDLTTLNEFFAKGGGELVTNVVREVGGKEPFTVAQFVRDYAPAFGKK